MQSPDAAESDSAARVILRARSQAPWRVASVSPLPDKSLVVQFVDGTTGRVELAGFLVSRAVDGTLFEALRDDVYFARADVIDGVVRWPNGADLAPDAMYETVRERDSTDREPPP
jgi:hypothetical protein